MGCSGWEDMLVVELEKRRRGGARETVSGDGDGLVVEVEAAAIYADCLLPAICWEIKDSRLAAGRGGMILRPLRGRDRDIDISSTLQRCARVVLLE